MFVKLGLAFRIFEVTKHANVISPSLKFRVSSEYYTTQTYGSEMREKRILSCLISGCYFSELEAGFKLDNNYLVLKFNQKVIFNPSSKGLRRLHGEPAEVYCYLSFCFLS